MTPLRSAALLLLCSAMQSPASVTPVDLQCDGNPLAAPQPLRLSWKLESTEPNQSQGAWQILVASRPELLEEGKADLWDSGKVAATRERFVHYQGKPLGAGTLCHWKVRSWDQDGQPSAWSQAASWETAPTTPRDWHGAHWINDGKANPKQDPDFYQNDPAPLLRREFRIEKPIARARLHVAGLGLCYPSLNGKRLDDQVFDPAWTNFDERILFRTHDVTSQLQNGANCIGLALGNGWFNPLPLRMWGHRNIREALPTGRPRAIACLVIDHTDGSQTVVTTGKDWQTISGPTLRNSIYLGEVRDARLNQPGWDRPGATITGAKPAHVVDAPLEPLQPLTMLPVRVLESLPARAITSPKPNTFIVDFGTNFTGLPELRLNVPAGTRITLRYGELLNPDGTLNPLTSVCGQIKGMDESNTQPKGGPGAPEFAWQQDSYTARGDGPEIFRPDFTFHAFRFMEITGINDAPAAETVRGLVLHTELPNAGTFESSNDLLNRIQQVCRRTFVSNVMTVQSDCPHRERFGYGGDIVATSETFMMNFDMAGFYAKTARDWGSTIQPNGLFPDTAPFVGVKYCGVGWGMVHPQLLEQLYQHYGDLDLVREQLPISLRWIRAEGARRVRGLVVTGLGDHEALSSQETSRGPEVRTPKFIDAARRIARLARLVGNEADAQACESMANESLEAWQQSFLTAATGKVADGNQTQQTFALGFGAVSGDTAGKSFDVLVNDLTHVDDAPRLTTGIYGTWKLMELLPAYGRNDLAFALATRTTFPSWGWMLKNDATTLWEHWAGSESTYSHNHPMFGSISGWFFRWLGGIQAAPDAIAFDRILIQPKPVNGLEWVKTSHDSARGKIVSNWQRTNDSITYEITVPTNTMAKVVLPHMEFSGIELPEGTHVIGKSAQATTLELGGGSYRFTSCR